MQILLLVLVLGGVLAAVLWSVAENFDPAIMSFHAWLALGLGTFFSLALAGGLMALVFHSARKGYDDRIEIDKSSGGPSGDPS